MAEPGLLRKCMDDPAGLRHAEVMKAEDVAVYVPSTADRASLVSLVRRAEDLGLHSVWFTETDLQRDPFVHAAAAAMLTERLHLGIGLVNVWKQLPVALATAAGNLADLAVAGTSLVLGPWHEPAAANAGAVRHDLIEAMTDATVIVRKLLDGASVTHTGKVFSATEARLPGRTAVDRVPLLWGANGPRMVAAAGALAARGLIDGVMINYLTSVGRVGEIIDVVRSDATAAGRSEADLHFPVVALVELTDDKDAAVERLRSFIEGSPELRREARFLQQGTVSFDDVESRLVAGTPAQCRARIDEFLSVGARPVTLYSRTPDAVMQRLFE